MNDNSHNSQNDPIVYLDTACLGLANPPVFKKIRQYLDSLENLTLSATDFTLQAYGNYAKARQEIATLFNVCEDEIALVESTSHGLGLIASTLPLSEKDNILICDLEFFATTLCWHTRQKEIGFELRAVKTEHGAVRLEDFESRIDQNTKAIVVSSVQEINGFRADIAGLGRLARDKGCYMIVDGIQEAGVLPTDLSQLNVDVYCAGGQKWIRSPFGLGFLYVRRELAKQLEPNYYGYFNALEPDEGWGPYLESPLRTPFDDIGLNTTAQKFETGASGNYLGALALYESIKYINKMGIDTIENKVRFCNDRLVEGLFGLNLTAAAGLNSYHQSGITSFNLPGGIDQERKLVKKLQQERVFVSLRYTSGIGGIRVSPHYYNTEKQIDKLLEIIEDFLK